uniref:Amino acid transport system permease n=1 Tax=Nocardioides sp. (strain JS1661) TaxID=1517491 RepID=A0A089MV11_NOCS1|nr:amino acid transport system permease [Nocardioides sp. JS1661]
MAQWLAITINGLAFGMLLFILASGLTLIFGLARYVNLGHGGVYLLTAYVSVETYQRTGSYWWAAAAALGLAAVLGTTIYVLFVRGRSWLRANPLPQVLLSFGIIYVIADLVQARYAGLAQSLPLPDLVAGSVTVAGATVTEYRLVLIGAGASVAVALWLLLTRTSFGSAVRAGVDDHQMLSAIGRNPERLFACVFGLGFMLTGLSGLLGSAFIGASPGVEYTIILYTLPIIVVGGMGSLSGAFIASILVGVGDSIGKAYFPEFSLFLIFAIVVLTLAVRPEGLVRSA